MFKKITLVSCILLFSTLDVSAQTPPPPPAMPTQEGQLIPPPPLPSMEKAQSNANKTKFLDFMKSKKAEQPAAANAKPDKTFNKVDDVDKIISDVEDKPVIQYVTPPTDYDYSLTQKSTGNKVYEQPSSKVISGLFASITRDDARAVEAYFSMNLNPDIRGVNGDTALCHAIRNNAISVANLLLKRGADVNAPCVDSNYPVHLAAQSKNTALLDVIFSRKVNTNVVNRDGENLLMVLVKAGFQDYAFKLPNFKIQAQSLDSVGRTALHYAAASNMPILASALINSGTDINLRDVNGYTPLMLAAYARNHDAVTMLLQKGADKSIQDNSGRTAVMLALLAGDAELVNILSTNR